MNKQELHALVDNNIVDNNRREITAKTMRTVLHAMIDNSGTGDSSIKTITVLLPNDATFEQDNANETLLANNVACFEAMLNQTEPLLIFMQYLGSDKPFAQLGQRVRTLHTQGEGTKFFAITYYITPYEAAGDVIPVVLSTDIFKLNPDGTIKKIPYDYVYAADIENLEQLLPGDYTVSADTVPGAFGSSRATLSFNTGSNTLTLSALTGNASDVQADCELQKIDNAHYKVLVPNGWVSNQFGRVDTDIYFDVIVLEESVTLRCSDTITTNAGDITGWTLTKVA